MSSPVSIVIPTYNGARYIREAIESVFAQTLLPREVIVVDDCSTDGTPDVVESMISIAPCPLRVIRLAKNSGGPAKPINVGVAESEGEFVKVLDQDDLLLPAVLDSQADALARCPNSKCTVAWGLLKRGDVSSDTHYAHLYAGITAAACQLGPYYVVPFKFVLRTLALHGMFSYGYPSMMFRRDAWQAMAGADERLRIASDFDILARLCDEADLVVVPSYGHQHRVHEGNACHNVLQTQLEVSIVKARLLAAHQWLRLDEDVRARLASSLATQVYWFRQGGRHAAALRCSLLALSSLGPSPQRIADVFKILAHFALHRLRIVKAVPSGYTTVTRSC